MDRAQLKSLKRTLIRGGVATAYVSRTLAELHDHYDDLEAEALEAGYSEADASEEATQRLGEGRVIAGEILNRQELKSWAFRWPWVPAVLRQLVILTTIAAVPAVMVVGRGPLIARWCVSTGLAALLKGGMLLLMQRLVGGGWPL